MTKSVLLALALFLAASAAHAQEYSTAVGARFGIPISASVKHFLDDANAIEGYVGFRGNSFYNILSVSGAYQRHYDLNLDGELANLRWYWGAGASFYNLSYDLGPLVDDSGFSTSAFGVNGYLGLQYVFDGAPIELTVDWVPSIFLGGTFGGGFGGGFQGGYGGLGVRYTLGR